jgi:hypothetical protein
MAQMRFQLFPAKHLTLVSTQYFDGDQASQVAAEKIRMESGIVRVSVSKSSVKGPGHTITKYLYVVRAYGPAKRG